MKNNLRGELSRIDFYLILLCLSLSHMCVAYLFLEWNIKGITDSLAATIVTPQIANNSSNPVWLAFFMSLKYFLFFFDLFSEFTMLLLFLYLLLFNLFVFVLLAPSPLLSDPFTGLGIGLSLFSFLFPWKIFILLLRCMQQQTEERRRRERSTQDIYFLYTMKLF